MTGARPVTDGLFRVREDGTATLLGGRCPACGTTTVMVRPFCPGCWAEGDLEPVELGANGWLYSFTIVRQAPKGFRPPYAMGYVDLDEGLRVLTRIAAPEAHDLRVGARVALTVAPLGESAEGETVVGPVFAVAEEDA